MSIYGFGVKTPAKRGVKDSWSYLRIGMMFDDNGAPSAMSRKSDLLTLANRGEENTRLSVGLLRDLIRP